MRAFRIKYLHEVGYQVGTGVELGVRRQHVVRRRILAGDVSQHVDRVRQVAHLKRTKLQKKLP